MAELCLDTIFNILSRLPIKSLFRFRCVCKSWHDYIDDPYLAIIHSKRGYIERMPIMFHQSPYIDPNLPRTLSLRIIEGHTATNVENMKKDLVSEYNCQQSFSTSPVSAVQGSCNGLLYLSQNRTFGVIQPLRKECYVLPPVTDTRLQYVTCSPREKEASGLGFDASTNAFKMVYVFPTRESDFVYLCVMVHVLGTNSWREISQVPSYHICGSGLFAHSSLHWLASDPQPCYGRKVIWFDVKKEEFGVIKAPELDESLVKYWTNENLVDLHGEVGYVRQIVDHSTRVWVLRQKEWVTYGRFDQTSRLPCSGISVQGCWNKDVDILMTSNIGHVYVYSLKNGVLQKVIDNIVGEEGKSCIQIYQGSLFTIHGINMNAYSVKN